MSLNRPNQLMPLWAGVITMLAGLQRTVLERDYGLGLALVAAGAILVGQFYWRHRKHPDA